MVELYLMIELHSKLVIKLITEHATSHFETCCSNVHYKLRYGLM